MVVIIDPVSVPREMLLRMRQMILVGQKVSCDFVNCRDYGFPRGGHKDWRCDRHYHAHRILCKIKVLLLEDLPL